MKKIVALIISLFILLFIGGCSPTERDLERKIELEEIKREIYTQAYEDGYKDATRAVINELPWYLVDMEDLEDSLYMIFDDGEYAEEIRDQIMTYCEIYESKDFAIEYSNDEMDYAY